MFNIDKNSTLCVGCLTNDRKLLSIEKYYGIYRTIMADLIDFNRNKHTEVPLMCWECMAVLRNVLKFRQKVLDANAFLLGSYVNTKNETLSNLNITNNREIIDVVYNDDKDISVEVKNEDIIKVALESKCIDFRPTIINNVLEDYTETNEKDEIADSKEKVLYDIQVAKEEKTDEIKDYIINVKDEPIENENNNSFDNYDVFNDSQSDVSIEKSRQKGSKKYKIIYLTDTPDNLMYKKVGIDHEERVYWFEQERNGKHFRSMAFKCEFCISGFAKEKYFQRHMKNFHCETSGAFACDICKVNLPTKRGLYRHIREHYVKYVCNVCDYQCYNDFRMKAHLYTGHKRAVECLKCSLRFAQFRSFHKHYRELHLKVTCDYCGINFTKKKRLINHIRLRHYEHKCVQCGKTYSTTHALTRHVNLHHVKSARELCYCVECNIQFDNVTLYTRHLKRSVKHRVVVGVPCPECGKVYHRRHVMMNHYNHVHMEKTSHYCEKCERYFLNGFRLRQHIASIHDKLPRAKNKICQYCDRGFATNRILQNHIRTHTGERPFVCEHCSATFAQRQALVSHTRAIHKILNFK